MFFSKPLIVLATAITIFAAPMARQFEEGATCTYVMTPSGPLDEADNINGEFNYAIGHTIASEIPSGAIDGSGISAAANEVGTYTGTGTFEGVGITEEELKAVVLSWPGKTLDGIPWFGLTWEVKSITCE